MYDERYMKVFLSEKPSNMKKDFYLISQYFIPIDIGTCKEIVNLKFSENLIGIFEPTIDKRHACILFVTSNGICTKQMDYIKFKEEYRRLRINKLV